MTTIPVFFTIDDKFTFYLDCAIRSIMEHASPDYHYRIIVLCENVSESDMEIISAAVKDPFEIEFVPMREGFTQITNRAENRLRCDYFTLSIYFRIFIADMFPEYDKGIYLDSDVIVPGDISKLYEKDLGENIIGACPDYSIRNTQAFGTYVEQAVGVPWEEYINSGILLMNLRMMRERKFCQRFLDLLNTYHFDTIAPDQDYINAICYGKILFLEESWDAMPPLHGERKLLDSPDLIHFNLFQKPWCYDNIKYEKYFWDCAVKSPYYSQILDFKAGYSAEQVESDNKSLDLMLRKAEEIISNDVTFRKIFESGAPVRI